MNEDSGTPPADYIEQGYGDEKVGNHNPAVGEMQVAIESERLRQGRAPANGGKSELSRNTETLQPVKSYLRNTWYAAAWSEEVSRQPATFVILNEEVLFYRSIDETPIALSNRCPHRFAEMHRGKLIGDCIQCPYHGLQFDASGACVVNPHGDKLPPPSGRLKPYPVAEKYGVLWIWMGNPEVADETLISDFSMVVEDDSHTLVKGRMSVPADYQLVTDNLLDLTHTEFLHAHFRAPGSSARSTFELIGKGEAIHSRWTQNEEPVFGVVDLLWQERGGLSGETVDTVRDARWTAPSNLMIEFKFNQRRNAGEKTLDPIIIESAHLLTPASGGLTHYLWATRRNAGLNSQKYDNLLREAVRIAFQEQDFPMLESQQRFIGDADLLSLKPAMLGTDAGAMRARLSLRRMIQIETNTGNFT